MVLLTCESEGQSERELLSRGTGRLQPMRPGLGGDRMEEQRLKLSFGSGSPVTSFGFSWSLGHRTQSLNQCPLLSKPGTEIDSTICFSVPFINSRLRGFRLESGGANPHCKTSTVCLYPCPGGVL